MADRKIVVDVELNDADAQKKLQGLDQAADQTGQTMSDGLAAGAQEAEEALADVSVTSTKSIGIFGQLRKGLNDLAEAEGITFKNMGLLGSATSVAAAAMAGWAIGRTIAEFTGLDAIIEKSAASLFGWGSAVEQAAGAKADVLARASQAAGREITSLTEATKINADEIRKNQNASIDWTAKLADAHREVRNLSDAKIRDIEIAQQAGASTQQLTDKFKVSALALEVLADRQNLAAKAAEAHKAQVEALDAAYSKLMSDTKNANQLAIMEDEAKAMQQRLEQQKLFDDLEIKARINRQQAEQEATKQAEAAEQARIAANQAEIDKLMEVAQAHATTAEAATTASDQTVQGYAGVAAQITLTGEAMKEYLGLLKFTMAANAINEGGSSLFQTQSQRDRLAALAGFGGQAGIPRLAQGGFISRPTLAIVGDSPGGEFVVPQDQMANFAGGGGSPIYLTLSVGSVDSDSRIRQIAQLVTREVAAAVNADRRQTMSRS